MASNVLDATLTIPNGATTPAAALSTLGCSTIAISAPGTLAETVSVVAPDGDVIQSPPGTDVTIAQAKSCVFLRWPYNTVSLKAGTAVAADRVFTVYGMS